jgi:hypothetical protein
VTPIRQLLTFQDRIYIPANLELRHRIVSLYHDSPSISHPGQQGTLRAVQHDYHWPGMNQFVKNYVRGCAECQQTKINRRSTHPPLKPIEGSTKLRPFSQCSMDLKPTYPNQTATIPFSSSWITDSQKELFLPHVTRQSPPKSWATFCLTNCSPSMAARTK